MTNHEIEFKSALVVGTVRNASRHIVKDLLQIVNALEKLMPTKAIIIESDSSDDTLLKLSDLVKNDSRIAFVSLGNLEFHLPERIDRLRRCRNEYVNIIRTNPLYRDAELIVVADLDGVNTKIDSAKFQKALGSKEPWDALAANQSAKYYDIFALRHSLWSPNSWVAEAQWLETFLGERVAKKHALLNRMIHIPPDVPPILVSSAFGGLCIYRRWVFEKCDYSTKENHPNEECEHVSFHQMLCDRGGRIYIHPALVNARWTKHSSRATWFIDFLRLFTKRTVSIFLPPRNMRN